MARGSLSTDDLTGQPAQQAQDVDRPRDDRPREGRASDDRLRDDRPRDDRPRDDRASDDRPSDDRPREDRPRDDETPYPQDGTRDDATSTDARGAGARSGTSQQEYAPLLDDREAEVFLDRWREVQARFVDDPQGAVRDGDGLVAELMQSLAQRFSDHKSGLEEQWNRGSEPETEELRRALQQYRSFFDRLLST
jgi:hypothetical protein